MTTTQWLLLLLGVAFVLAWVQISSALDRVASAMRKSTATVEKRIRRIRKTLETLPRRPQVRTVEPRPILLGHMHGGPEAVCWEIADTAGKLLKTLPVDVDGVEAEIAARMKTIAKQYPAADTVEITDADRRAAEERAMQMATDEGERQVFWFARSRFVRRRTAELVAEELNKLRTQRQDEADKHRRWREDFLSDEESRVRAELWTQNAFEAAQVVFPVCRLRSTDCGYDIVL